MLANQLSLFPIDRGYPTWDDVQKGRAKAVKHAAYSMPCKKACMWSGSIYDGKCYLFAKPIINGKCPGTTCLEWDDE